MTVLKHRLNFTQLRISNHNLEIEKGRFRKPYIKPQNRICPVHKREIEDKIHFLLRWPSYENIRQNFFQTIKSFRKIAPKVAMLISKCKKV